MSHSTSIPIFPSTIGACSATAELRRQAGHLGVAHGAHRARVQGWHGGRLALHSQGRWEEVARSTYYYIYIYIYMGFHKRGYPKMDGL